MPGRHERFKNTTGCHTSALGERLILKKKKECKRQFARGTLQQGSKVYRFDSFGSKTQISRCCFEEDCTSRRGATCNFSDSGRFWPNCSGTPAARFIQSGHSSTFFDT